MLGLRLSRHHVHVGAPSVGEDVGELLREEVGEPDDLRPPSLLQAGIGFEPVRGEGPLVLDQLPAGDVHLVGGVQYKLQCNM